MLSQSIYEVFDHQKTDLLIHLLKMQPEMDTVVVYVIQKNLLHATTTALGLAGILADSIHATKKPELRERSMKELTKGQIRVLVCSAAISRDLEIEGVKYIINFDIPEVGDDYGRRCQLAEGNNGEVITFLTPNKPALKEKLNSLAGTDLPCKTAENSHLRHPIRKNPHWQQRQSKTQVQTPPK